MSDSYIGEIRAFGFNFIPKDWVACDGSLLPIQQFTPLFAIIGVTYGGDGRSTFAVPDLRGRSAIGFGAGPGLSDRQLGESGGAYNHTLVAAEVPAHGHTLAATGAATTGTPGPTTLLGVVSAGSAYQAPGTVVTMAPNQLSSAGSGQPHENRQPFLGLTYGICTVGVFPPRS